jgi:hypothetical protein
VNKTAYVDLCCHIVATDTMVGALMRIVRSLGEHTEFFEVSLESICLRMFKIFGASARTIQYRKA